MLLFTVSRLREPSLEIASPVDLTPLKESSPSGGASLDGLTTSLFKHIDRVGVNVTAM